MGMNIITISDVGFLTDYDADLGILFGPYLTEDPQKLFAIYASDWFKQKEQKLREKGVHIVMSNYLYGTRQIIAKKPIRTPEDLKGMKIRVPNNVMQIKAIEAMGATLNTNAAGRCLSGADSGDDRWCGKPGFCSLWAKAA